MISYGFVRQSKRALIADLPAKLLLLYSVISGLPKSSAMNLTDPGLALADPDRFGNVDKSG